VWIGGNDAKDHQVLKFTREGKFLLQIGKADQTGGDADTAHLGRPANMNVDPATNELFIADGYKNHRVIVFDAQTGAYKRHWGANGRPPGDPSVKSFGNPVHCARLAKDGSLYVCDRANNRIQVFKKDGTFVKEFVVAPATRGGGSVWDVDVSHDAPQTWLYNADGENNHVWTLLRDNGQVVSKFGRNGRQAGQFHWVHNLAVDSKGNVYTAEVDTGKRAQRFLCKGSVPLENLPPSVRDDGRRRQDRFLLTGPRRARRPRRDHDARSARRRDRMRLDLGDRSPPDPRQERVALSVLDDRRVSARARRALARAADRGHVPDDDHAPDPRRHQRARDPVPQSGLHREGAGDGRLSLRRS